MKSMVRVFIKPAVLLLLIGIATGCENVRPILNVENYPIAELSPPLTLKQMEARIIKAGRLRNWRLRAVAPGKIRGDLRIKRRSAIVSITYNQIFFSIRYESSEDLYAGVAWQQQQYAGQFVIHRKYNSHVRALQRSIARALSFPE